MHLNSGVTRSWEARHPQFMKPRDALINFQVLSPDLVEASVIINGECIHTETVPRDPDVVSKMETKYMFFADEAATARIMVRKGTSCIFSVYFREP